MPFTPLHLGPAILFGFLLFSYIDFPTFIIANVILDIEPFLNLYFNIGNSLHGFFHSFIGASIVALIISPIMFYLRKPLKKLLESFGLKQKTSFKKILLASLSGVYLHVFLDSFLYSDIKPFFPSIYNPIYDMLPYNEIINFCIFSLFAGVFLYVYKLINKK
jgi:membrane-bound metal-dependent hydrolase YbcI (DUF457 family)